MLKRIINNFNIRRRARKLKVRFTFLRTFSLPNSIFINGDWANITYPSERGMWSAFVEIFLVDGYCFETLSAKKIRTIVDVGANVGFFSMAARNFFPDASITAFEPNKDLEKYLRQNLGALNVDIHIQAVGRINTRVSLHLQGNDSIMTSVVEDSHSDIEQVAFDDIANKLNPTIDLLKLDCEGSEWEILKDVQSMQKVRFLVMEYHLHSRPGSTIDDMKQLLDDCGFNIHTLREDIGFGFIMAYNKSEPF